MLRNVTPSIISILDRTHFNNARKTLFNQFKNIFLAIRYYLDIIYSLIVSIFEKKYHSRRLYLITTKFKFLF